MGALVNSVEKDGPAEKAGVESGDIIIKVDGRDVRSVQRAAADHHRGPAGQEGHADGLAQGRAEGDRRHRRGDEGRRAAHAAPQQRAGAEGKGEAEPDGPRARPTSPTSRGRSSTSRPACWSRTSPARVRGNVQPGDVILAIISSGADDRGEERRANQRAAGEAGEGRVGHAAAAARRAAVLRDAQAAERRVTRDAASEPERSAGSRLHGRAAADACVGLPAAAMTDAAVPRVLPSLRRDARGAAPLAARHGATSW